MADRQEQIDAVAKPSTSRRSSTSPDSDSDMPSLNGTSADDARLAALRGQALPEDPAVYLQREGEAAVVHGIRHHLAFAQSPAVVALCQNPARKIFARARHARLIMSDLIPEIPDDGDAALLPYCIWHPDVAREATYHEVARRYPALRYSVARACAVAGYAGLYRELDVLPEVTVAEEAQASSAPGAREISDAIMAAPVRYGVMNDYENRLFAEPRAGARLNADTAVVPVLRRVRTTHTAVVPDAWPRYWDVEEDGYIGEENLGHAGDDYCGAVGEVERALLSRPLPEDLPAGVNKDVLILMAAYEGNADRYARLERPGGIRGEEACIARGIFHSTTFALHWSARGVRGALAAAVHARRAMLNDLSWLVPALPEEELPYMIWYPLRPRHLTLWEIARREPRMWLAVAHACVACGYRPLFDLLLPRIKATRELRWEAERGADRHFEESLRRVKTEGGGRGEAEAEEDKEPTETLVSGQMDVDAIGEAHHPAVWAGYGANAAALELYLMVPEAIRKAAAESEVGNFSLYEADDDVDRAWDESIFEGLETKD
ncbi:hypothetical protein ISF_05947 [Cordyceps fumosorosea ARSEF 2679]|uniref:Uncharacterized protein n=1 Tax=Cordyceps fumosorosea (strain ARSEF 2679) TaxID=1081104 RepID=A0A167SUG8_CORFA|nr:hypothetical protein ISF_05947 [Cordyceps fumosorosea ARSEF 2679]OAA59936.1 hypothetical protein ISF_05947 [Cordyceps fumosorosea ARSEF 2679]